jgi:hypothetical protein
MELKKIKKLVLKQETISSLSGNGMNKIKGGDTILENLLCSYGCGNTPGTCDCPSYYCFSKEGQSVCYTCGGVTGYGMCCETPTAYC